MTDVSSDWPSPLVDNFTEIEGGEWPVFSLEEGKTFSQFKETNQLLVRTITWNLHAKDPPSVDVLREKLLPFNKFHILFFTSQECDHTIAQSTVLTSKARWEATLKEAIGSSYSTLCSHTLQAIHTILFVHKDLLFATKLVRSHAVPTGIGNTLGNKGGVGMWVEVGSVSLLFVGCHLAAGQSDTSSRNEHYQRILAELNRVMIRGSKEEEEEETSQELTDRFPFVFWCGDLNYRISSERKLVDSLLERNKWDVLVAIDQLKNEQAFGNAFQEFEEGPLYFKPTYKFDTKSGVYDTSAKKRVPSWTDRILYKPNSNLQLTAYDSVTSIQTSDHRPVFASFKLKLAPYLPQEAEEDPISYWKQVKINNAISKRKERKEKEEEEEEEEERSENNEFTNEEEKAEEDDDTDTVHTYEYEYLTDQSSSQVCILS